MAGVFASTTLIPIRQLNAQLSEPSKKSIRATVTLIWPYSSSNATFRIRLAEPDTRLRQANGEVCVLFHGSSARSVFDAGIGSGDEVTLSLEGVEWFKNISTTITPRRGVEWELKYTERLLIEIRESETQKVTTLDIDHPTFIDRQPVADISALDDVLSPPKSTALTPGRSGLVRAETNEWSSPAFIKRARLSYGSLMESSYDIFADDDGTIQGKGRKRSKFSRDSASWRYNSRSPSPEAEMTGDRSITGTTPNTVDDTKPLMLDESCQTTGLDYDVTRSVRDLSWQRVAVIEETSQREDSACDAMSELQQSDDPSTFPPPPRPQLIESASQVDIGEQQVVDGASIIASSPRFRSVQSGGLSLVSPLVSPILGEIYSPPDASTNWNEPPILQSQVLQPLGSQAVEPNSNELHPFDCGDFDAADQYGQWQSAVVAHNQMDHSQPMPAFYPEINVQSTGETETPDSGPYFVNHQIASPLYFSDRDFPTRDHIENHVHLQFEDSSDGREGQEAGNLSVQHEHKKSHHSSTAMSRSQSALSETIDLTEESSDDAEPDDMDVPGTVLSKEIHRSDLIEDETDAEDKDEEDPYAEKGEDTAESQDEDDISEDDLTEDGFAQAMYPPGFHFLNQSNADSLHREAIEEEYNEEDHDKEFEEEVEEEFEEEVGEEYDEDYDEDYGDEDLDPDVRRAIERMAHADTEVIDLLSSDEEDAAAKEDITGENINSNSSEMEVAATVAGEKAVRSILHDLTQKQKSMILEQKEEFARGSSHNLAENKKDLAYIEQAQINYVDGDTPLSSEEVLPKKNKREDEFNEIDTVASMELQDAVEDETRNLPFGYDGYQDPEAANIEVDESWVVVPKAFAQDISEGQVKGIRLDKKQLKQSTPKVLADTVSQDKLRTLDDGDGGSSSFEKRHDGRDDHAAAQITFGGQLGQENTETITALAHVNKGKVSKAASFERKSDMITNVGDEHVLDVAYPKLPLVQADGADEGIDGNIATKDSFAEDSQGRITNGQLPTPDATQLVAEFSKEVASSLTDRPPPKTSSQQLGQVEVAVIRQQDAGRSIAILQDSTVQSSATAKPSIIQPETSKRHIRTRSSTSQHSVNTEKFISTIVDDPKTPVGHDASAELALDALESPSKTDSHYLPAESLRMKLTKFLRTNLPDFTPLKSIRLHLDHRLDVLAIATTATHPQDAERAKHGPRQYQVRFNVTDPSLTNSVTEVQIFRAYKDALPLVKAGEGILLRNFQARSEQGRGFPLRSEETSSWVVFQVDGAEDMRGPPVEYGDAERGHVASLKSWFLGLDVSSKTKLDKANGEKKVSPRKSSVKGK